MTKNIEKYTTRYIGLEKNENLFRRKRKDKSESKKAEPMDHFEKRNQINLRIV